MHLARLLAADAPQYRELMLEAYAQAADAFTSTAEERAHESLSWWENRTAGADGSSESFGVFESASLVGSVTLQYSAKLKTRHSALVVGMYVRPNHRGSGAAAALVQAAIAAAKARPEIQSLRLTVTNGNEPAIRLYTSAGFVAWGTEPHAIRTQAGFKGKIHMSLLLCRGATST